jgi:chromosome segregation ATPase
MFRESQELFRLRQSEANLIAEISGAQTADKNLRLKIHTLDSESMKQQELIYNADFSIQALERKVSRASGQRSADEKKVLNARIEELTAQLEEQANQQTLLTHQLKRLNDDMRATTRRLADLSVQEARLQEKISELHLTNETIARDLKSQVKLKEETIVAHDLLRLECKKLRDILNEKADQVSKPEPTRTHARTHAHTHTHTSTRARAHTQARVHAHTRARTITGLQPRESEVSAANVDGGASRADPGAPRRAARGAEARGGG